MQKEWKRIVGIIGLWILLSAFLWYFHPLQISWLWMVPIIFVIAVPVTFAAVILIRPFLPKPITSVLVCGKITTACMFCKMADVKNNVINPNYPVVKCLEKGRKTNYTPMKIPRWCPHAR